MRHWVTVDAAAESQMAKAKSQDRLQFSFKIILTMPKEDGIKFYSLESKNTKKMITHPENKNLVKSGFHNIFRFFSAWGGKTQKYSLNFAEDGNIRNTDKQTGVEEDDSLNDFRSDGEWYRLTHIVPLDLNDNTITQGLHFRKIKRELLSVLRLSGSSGTDMQHAHKALNISEYMYDRNKEGETLKLVQFVTTFMTYSDVNQRDVINNLESQQFPQAAVRRTAREQLFHMWTDCYVSEMERHPTDMPQFETVGRRAFKKNLIVAFKARTQTILFNSASDEDIDGQEALNNVQSASNNCVSATHEGSVTKLCVSQEDSLHVISSQDKQQVEPPGSLQQSALLWWHPLQSVCEERGVWVCRGGLSNKRNHSCGNI
jgi:hypothetical protein